MHPMPSINAVIRQYSSLLWKNVNYCWSRFPSNATRPDKEDLYQEGVLIIYEALDRFDPDKASFFTYLYRILSQRFARILHKAHRHREHHFPRDNEDLDMMEARTVFRDERLGQMFEERLSRRAYEFARLMVDPTERFLTWCRKNYRTNAKAPRLVACRVGRYLGMTADQRRAVMAELRSKLCKDESDEQPVSDQEEGRDRLGRILRIRDLSQDAAGGPPDGESPGVRRGL